MGELTWDELFFNLVKEYRAKSKDPSSKFGCVLVDDAHNPVGFGFNGFPRRVEDSPERYADRELKYKMVVHAEAASIANAAKQGHKTDGCRLYIDTYPCSVCCGILIDAGIKEIVLNGDSEIHNSPAFQERWKETIEITKTMCSEAGVVIRIYKK
jgi:dCMP deaminase